MIFLSDEDTDSKAIVESWLHKEPEETRQYTEKLINQYFISAFDWILAKVELNLHYFEFFLFLYFFLIKILFKIYSDASNGKINLRKKIIVFFVYISFILFESIL